MKLKIIIFFLFSCNTFAAKELFIYSSRKEHLVKNIFRLYEKETGVKIKYRTGQAGALIQALKSEGDNTPADLFLTVDAGNLGFAASERLLEPIVSEKLSRRIPEHLRDGKNRWFGLSLRARTLVYNNKKVDPSELSSYEDLATYKWKGRLCLRTGKKVYNQSLVAMLIHELGRDRAKSVVAGWVRNTVDIFSSDTSVLKAVAAGKCDVGIVNSYYYGRLLKKNPSLPLSIFWPNQHSYGVHVNVSGAGVTRHSKNKKEAINFLEWLSEKKAQNEFARINMEYPVSKNIPTDSVVRDWGLFKQNSTFQLTALEILQKDAVRLINEVRYR